MVRVGVISSLGGSRTDSGMSLLANDQDAFNKGSARVVDAVKHCLHGQYIHVHKFEGNTPLIESS